MNYEQMNNNKVYLRGTVVSQPEYSHEIYGEGFYEVMMSVPRLSDYNDNIPITVSERFLQEDDFNVGNTVAIKGQFRSYNKQVESKNKLMLTVFVREVIEGDESVNPNSIEISGYVCKSPIYRTTPFKREICDILVAVNRAYNKSDYLPCIAWGRNARFVKDQEVGKKLIVEGRIQSREYQKKIGEEEYETRTAYEVSVSKVSNGANVLVEEMGDDSTYYNSEV